MDVRYCKVCGKMFDYTGSALCPNCNKAMDDKFVEVKKYIYDNPGATMARVSEDNDVPLPQIKKWIKEERLSFAENSGIKIRCEKCGTFILTGRFCKECKKQMSDNLSSMYENKSAAPKNKRTDGRAKMRFLDDQN